MAASVGLSVLVVELEGRSGIQHAFGAPEALEYSEVQLSTWAAVCGETHHAR